MPRLTLAELETLLDEHSPRWRAFARILALGPTTLVLEMPWRTEHARAGGTVSGPALMTLADRAAYYLTLAQVGPFPDAVTANLDIHFLVRPLPGEVTATATLLLLGSAVAVSNVDLHARDRLVAYATVTYALPAAAARDGDLTA